MNKLKKLPYVYLLFLIIPCLAIIVFVYGRSTSFLGDPDGHSGPTELFFNIFVMNADGSNVVQLTNNENGNTGASFSPDGNKILYSTGSGVIPSNTYEIYIMDADGSNVTRLTNNKYDDYNSRFSPDGTKIAFVSYRDTPLNDYDFDTSGKGDIYVMNIDGSNVTRITETSTAREDFLTWSPDGTKIAFIHTTHPNSPDGNVEIYVVNADGTGLVEIKDKQDRRYSLHKHHMAWSQDSTQLFFSASDRSTWDSGNFTSEERLSFYRIYRANADGSGIENITPTGLSGYFDHPKPSPDGAKIAFFYGPGTREPNHPYDYAIYVMNTDGSDLVQLTEPDNPKSNLSWSQDSGKITYTAEPTYDEFVYGYEIYVVNADGTGSTRLTENEFAESSPKWSPDGTKILYVKSSTRYENDGD